MEKTNKMFIIHMSGMAGPEIGRMRNLISYDSEYVKEFAFLDIEDISINPEWPYNLISKIEEDIQIMPDSIKFIELPTLSKLCIISKFYEYFIEAGYRVVIFLPTSFDVYEKMLHSNIIEDVSSDRMSRVISRAKDSYNEYMTFGVQCMLKRAAIVYSDYNVDDILNGNIDEDKVVCVRI